MHVFNQPLLLIRQVKRFATDGPLPLGRVGVRQQQTNTHGENHVKEFLVSPEQSTDNKPASQ